MSGMTCVVIDVREFLPHEPDETVPVQCCVSRDVPGVVPGLLSKPITQVVVQGFEYPVVRDLRIA